MLPKNNRRFTAEEALEQCRRNRLQAQKLEGRDQPSKTELESWMTARGWQKLPRQSPTQTIRDLSWQKDQFIACDIVERAPTPDPAEVSSCVAAKLLRELLLIIAPAN